MYTKSDWKPRRRGVRYCARACGRGCTYLEYTAAKVNAEKLATSLGKGWKPVVWENLGWHWKAVKSAIQVYGSSGKRLHFMAFINEPSRHPGGKWTGDGRTPRAAIAEALSEAELDVANASEILMMARKAAA